MSDNIEKRSANAVSGWLALVVWVALSAAALWQILAVSAFFSRPPGNVHGFIVLPVLVFLARGVVIL